MAEFLDSKGLTTLTTLIKTDISTLKPSACLITLKASGWDATLKTQTATVSGVSADEASCMIIPMPAIASQSAYNDAGVNCVGQSANGVTFGCNNVPSVDLKVWVTWEKVNDTTFYAPAKGTIINMDLDGNGAKQYRIIKSSGEVAQVIAMYDTLTSKWNNTNTTTTIGGSTVQKYEGSTLDTYLNTTWYNTLSDTTKAAIVPENIICDVWSWDFRGIGSGYSGTYGSSVPGTERYAIWKETGGTLNIGNRNVFVLGVQDVIDYLSDESMRVDTTAILRNVNIWKMFWNDEVSHSNENLWLRSSYIGRSTRVMYAIGSDGALNYCDAIESCIVRPALNLNLSQIEFSIVS